MFCAFFCLVIIGVGFEGVVGVFTSQLLRYWKKYDFETPHLNRQCFLLKTVLNRFEDKYTFMLKNSIFFKNIYQNSVWLKNMPESYHKNQQRVGSCAKYLTIRAIISCRYSNWPLPQVQWLDKDRQFFSHHEYRIIVRF